MLEKTQNQYPRRKTSQTPQNKNQWSEASVSLERMVLLGKKKNAWECTRQSWGHHIIQLQSPHSILLALLPFQWLYHLHPCSKLLSILFRFTWNEESFSSCSQEGSAKSPQGPTLTLTSMTLTLTSFSFIFTFPLIRLRLSIVCSNQQIQHFLWKWVCSFSKDSLTSVVNIGILPS